MTMGMPRFWHAGIAAPALVDRPMRIGVLEDSPTTHTLLRAWLEERGGFIVTDQTHSIQEAVRWMDSEDLDAVLVDWHLPHGDGWALAQALKDARPGVQVFIYTSEKEPTLRPHGVHWLDKVALARWPSLIHEAVAQDEPSQA